MNYKRPDLNPKDFYPYNFEFLCFMRKSKVEIGKQSWYYRFLRQGHRGMINQGHQWAKAWQDPHCLIFLWLSVTYPVSRTQGRGPSNPGRNLTVEAHHESWKKNCDKRRRGSRTP